MIRKLFLLDSTCLLIFQKKKRINEKKKSRDRRAKRIILIRHAESEGNVDVSIYGRVPDNLIHLSELGVKQAQEVGRKLKELIGEETVRFFYSPYRRSEEVLIQIFHFFQLF